MHGLISRVEYFFPFSLFKLDIRTSSIPFGEKQLVGSDKKKNLKQEGDISGKKTSKTK